MKLIVGLGNPGSSYRDTRHNLGASWVRLLCQKYSINLQNNPKINAVFANLNNKALCVISNSYMNHSGFTVKNCCNYYKILISEIIVVHDDLDLNPGQIKVKLSGGHGGHNGLRHIIEQLQDNNFVRIRIGIGKLVNSDISDYVLAKPNKTDSTLINNAMEQSLSVVPELLENNCNWNNIMQFLHTKD